MISYEITIQEIIDILMYPDYVTNEFLFWIQYKRYPILNWIREVDSLYVFQKFDTTSDVMWWIPIRFISEPSSFRNILFKNSSRVLSLQNNFLRIFYTIKDDWIMINNQQSDKYTKNYLYIYYVIIFW